MECRRCHRDTTVTKLQMPHRWCWRPECRKAHKWTAPDDSAVARYWLNHDVERMLRHAADALPAATSGPVRPEQFAAVVADARQVYEAGSAPEIHDGLGEFLRRADTDSLTAADIASAARALATY